MQRIRVWDWPTRLVHWLLVALVGFSWWSAENHEMQWHRYSGYAVLGVLLFRIYWGVVGSDTARFSKFIKGPNAIVAYLRNGTAGVGHTPLGALSVMVLLLLLVTQVGLGLFAVDVDGLESGPLSYLVSFDTGRLCAEIHEWVFNTLMLFITLHVAAVFFYLLFQKNNLIVPMVTGSKPWSGGQSPSLKFASWWVAVIGIVLSVAIVWWIV